MATAQDEMKAKALEIMGHLDKAIAAIEPLKSQAAGWTDEELARQQYGGYQDAISKIVVELADDHGIDLEAFGWS